MPGLYYLMNFNDFGSALVVLFQQMVINNWYVVIDMYTILTGHIWYTHIYFVSFWVFVVLILMNIMIAIVLEIHDVLKIEIDKKFMS